MTIAPDNPSLPLSSIPEPPDAQLGPLLDEPFASAWPLPTDQTSPSVGSVRERLLARARRSRAAELAMYTCRRGRAPGEPLADGVSGHLLYQARDGVARRPGEPTRVRLIELAAGAGWTPPVDSSDRLQREWLVLDGQVRFGSDLLGRRDYRIGPGSRADGPLQAVAAAALVFLRESQPPSPDAMPSEVITVLDAVAGWQDYVPGIRRRVLWQHGGQAAMLYHAEGGASVPLHRHQHDEECLMLQGQLFLDDLLLRAGDYQLAPAGTGHHTTQTDTGVVVYAHGDLEIDLIAA